MGKSDVEGGEMEGAWRASSISGVAKGASPCLSGVDRQLRCTQAERQINFENCLERGKVASGVECAQGD
jgi:hypothetical protein